VAAKGCNVTQLLKPYLLGQVRYILKQEGAEGSSGGPGILPDLPDPPGPELIPEAPLGRPEGYPITRSAVAGLTLEQLQARTGHCHLDPCAGPGCACVCTSCSQTDLAARTAAKAQRRSQALASNTALLGTRGSLDAADARQAAAAPQAAPGRVGKPGVATAPAQAPEAPPELTSADLEAAAAEALASLQPTSYLADEEDL
jgi:hypothetical protein